jgi:hypothetical protein
MKDELWAFETKRETSLEQLMKRLVLFDDAVGGVGDPYYQDLYQVVIDRAREILLSTGGESPQNLDD